MLRVAVFFTMIAAAITIASMAPEGLAKANQTPGQASVAR